MKRYQNIYKKKKMNFEDSAKFFHSLYQLSQAGIPIIRALDVMDTSMRDKTINTFIKEKIQRGRSVHDSLQDSQVFSKMAISIVKMGEESGNIDSAFEKLSIYYEKREKNKRQVYSSLLYPAILFVAVFFLIGFILYYFIPSIMNLYNFDYGQLRGVSRSIFVVSKVLNTYKLEAPIMLANVGTVLVFFLSDLYKNTQEKVFFYTFPIVGKLRKSHSMSTILWGYYTMLSSGLDLIKASKIIKEQASNRYDKQKMECFLKNLQAGNSITQSLENIQMGENNIKYFISLGEESGNIIENVKIISELYEEKFQKELKRISTVLQPFLIVFITGMVASLMIFVILPMLTVQ